MDVKPVYYSTYKIAKMVHVAPRTVSKWIDTGLLPGFRLPGSNHRRVAQDDLIAFVIQHKLPMHELKEAEWLK